MGVQRHSFLVIFGPFSWPPELSSVKLGSLDSWSPYVPSIGTGIIDIEGPLGLKQVPHLQRGNLSQIHLSEEGLTDLQCAAGGGLGIPAPLSGPTLIAEARGGATRGHRVSRGPRVATDPRTGATDAGSPTPLAGDEIPFLVIFSLFFKIQGCGPACSCGSCGEIPFCVIVGPFSGIHSFSPVRSSGVCGVCGDILAGERRGTLSVGEHGGRGSAQRASSTVWNSRDRGVLVRQVQSYCRRHSLRATGVHGRASLSLSSSLSRSLFRAPVCHGKKGDGRTSGIQALLSVDGIKSSVRF